MAISHRRMVDHWYEDVGMKIDGVPMARHCIVYEDETGFKSFMAIDVVLTDEIAALLSIGGQGKGP